MPYQKPCDQAQPPAVHPHVEEPALKKSYVTILEQEIDEGSGELERSSAGLLLSGVSGGLDVSFSVLLIAVIQTASAGQIGPAVLRFLEAGAYTVGFILVIFGRSELFTEHTTLAVLPVLARRESTAQLLRLWSLVYVANLSGACGASALFSWLGPELGVVGVHELHALAERTVNCPPDTMLVSGVVAGWLMGLVSWLVTAGRDTVGQIIFVALVTGAIGLCRLHHCIVGSIEVLTGVFAGAPVGPLDYFRFLGITTVGNAVGGSVFVALLKFAHARVGPQSRRVRRR